MNTNSQSLNIEEFQSVRSFKVISMNLFQLSKGIYLLSLILFKHKHYRQCKQTIFLSYQEKESTPIT